MFTAEPGTLDRVELGKRFSVTDALAPRTELLPLLHDPEPRLRRLLAGAAWLHAWLQPAANSATLEISCDSSDLPDVWARLSEYKVALGVLNLDVQTDIDNRRGYAHAPGAATLLAGENGMHIRQGWYKVRVAGLAVAAENVRIADARVFLRCRDRLVERAGCVRTGHANDGESGAA